MYEWASLVAQTVKCLPAVLETWVRSLGREDLPGEEDGNPFQYFCLENSMDGEAWWATVHGVAKSHTRLSDFTSLLHLLSMAPPIRTRPSLTLSQSLPLGSFHKPLILIPHRADRMKTKITEN